MYPPSLDSGESIDLFLLWQRILLREDADLKVVLKFVFHNCFLNCSLSPGTIEVMHVFLVDV